MADGSRHILYVAPEGSYGDIGTNPALQALRITGTTLGLARDSLQSNEIRDDRQISDFRLSGDNVTGDVNFELSYGSFDMLFEAGLLSPGWETDQPAAGTDRLRAGVARRSFSFVRHFSDLAASEFPYFHYYGCEVSSITLTIAANAMVTGAFTIVGKGQTLLQNLSTMGVPTYTARTTTPPVDSFTGVLEENGSTLGVVTEMSLTLENGITPRFVVGSRQTINPSVGNSNLTGSMTVFFESGALVKKFVDEAESDLYFSMPDLEGNLIEYRIPRIKYTGGQPDVSGVGPVTLTMPFQALFDPTLGTNIAMDRTSV